MPDTIDDLLDNLATNPLGARWDDVKSSVWDQAASSIWDWAALDA